MYPVYLKVTNFGSFKESSYNFEEGLVLVEGRNDDKEGSSNGSGKSFFMIDGVSWLLFDNTCRGVRYDEVIRKGEKFTEAELVLDTGDVIKRSKVLGKGSIVSINDTKVEQSVVEDLIGLDYTSFTAAVVHAQTFRGFADRGEVEQKGILTKLMGLEKWDDYKKLADDKIIAVRRDIGTCSVHTDSIKERLINLKLPDVELLQKQFQADKQVKIDKKTQEIEDLKQEIKDKKDKLSKFSELEKERISLIENKSINEVILVDVENGLNDLEKEFEVQKERKDVAKKEQTKIEKQIVNINGLRGNCPICFSKVTKESKDKCLIELNKNLNELLDKSAKDYEIFISLIEKIDYQKECVNKIKVKIKTLWDKILILEGELKKKDILSLQIVNNRDKLTNLIESIKIIKTEKNPTEGLRVSLEKEKAELEKQLEIYKNDYNTLLELQKYYEFWVEGFSNRGIKSYIFDSLMPEFTERTNNYMQLLTNSDIEIIFDTQREKKTGGLSEKFTIKIKDEVGERPYLSWSGGEKKRIAVAIDLALSDIVLMRGKKVWDYVVFDELFDSIDEEGREMMIYLMESIMRERKRVIIISHDDATKGVIDKRVLIIKQDGVSSIA